MGNENKVIPTTENAEISENEAVQAETIAEMNPSSESKPEEKRCPNCQALLTEEQVFCPECGTAFKKICPNCKTEIQDGQAFCPSCGQKIEENVSSVNGDIAQFNAGIEKQKNKKKVLPIILGVVGVIAIAAIMIVINTMKTQKIDNYMSDAKAFASLTIEAGANLEDIADTTQEYWYDAIWNDKYNDDINTAILYAMIDKSEEIETAKEQYSKMEKLYNRLKKVPDGVEDENIDEICDAVKELYNDYTDFYSLATDPSGNYNSFSSSNNEKTDALMSSYRALDNLID